MPESLVEIAQISIYKCERNSPFSSFTKDVFLDFFLASFIHGSNMS